MLSNYLDRIFDIFSSQWILIILEIHRVKDSQNSEQLSICVFVIQVLRYKCVAFLHPSYCWWFVGWSMRQMEIFHLPLEVRVFHERVLHCCKLYEIVQFFFFHVNFNFFFFECFYLQMDTFRMNKRICNSFLISTRDNKGTANF